ncbi:MAG: hypothetical protein GX769_03495 [Erysipelothrix sp.]|nr:hypothetical protein [Erysipelothrix sp.]
MNTITKRNKWTYSVGCIGRDMIFILVSMFMLPYIQYTMNLTVAQFSAISTIMIFSRVWDAFNDPIMGMIIENSRLKGGKFRPWVMLGGVSNFAITILLFLVRPTGWAFVLFFGIAYIAWGMTFTINDIAYWSLLPNLSSNNDERNELTNLVLIFASIGQFIAGGLIPILVTGNAVWMYKVLGISISFIFLAFTLLTYFGVSERIVVEEKQGKVNLKKMYSILFKNDQLIIVAIALLLYTIAIELFMAFGINFFYFEFGYGGVQLTIFTVFFALGSLTALLVFPFLTKHYKRMKIMGIGTLISVIGYLSFLSLGYLIPMNEIILYTSAFFIFFGLNLFFVVLVVMTANVIEYNEIKTGERNESIIFSIRPFMTKLGAALQQAIVTLVLIISGVYVYSQQIADLEIQKSQGLLQEISSQANVILSSATPKMLLMLRIGMGLIPMISIVIAYLLIKSKYTITEEKYDQILIDLAKIKLDK